MIAFHSDDRIFDADERIFDFLLAGVDEEFRSLERDDVDPVTKFVYLRVRECYWTVTRLIGLGWLHDGSPKPGRKEKRPELADGQVGRYTRWSESSSRIMLDVTPTFRLGGATGIQRVVREIATGAFQAELALPVIIENGRVLPYCVHPSLPAQIGIRPGDKFVMLDATWNFTDEYLPLIQNIAGKGAEIVVGLHDINPFLYPLSVNLAGVARFKRWFEKIALKGDAVICVSAWSAMTFKNYVMTHNCRFEPGLRLGWWRLGANFQRQPNARPTTRAIKIAAAETPFFLSVGTLEPRKAYAVALSAFDKLWRSGVDVRYVIVGGVGWMSYALERRIKSHREYGRRLIWLDRASDSDLGCLYAHARALVFTSVAEGFGLPLVEATHHGLPIIASDLSPFREICGDNARYFALLDHDDLARQIRECLGSPKLTIDTETYTWRESTASLIEIIRNDRYQLRLLDDAQGVAGEDQEIAETLELRDLDDAVALA
jgi:glycosyltransferase involved in cell wall biosynthesis